MKSYTGFILGLLMGLIPTFCIHVYNQILIMEHEDEIIAARSAMKDAIDMRDNLLSNGRFVRVYDPKRNLNYYTFKPFVTDYKYGVEPKYVALKK